MASRKKSSACCRVAPRCAATAATEGDASSMAETVVLSPSTMARTRASSAASLAATRAQGTGSASGQFALRRVDRTPVAVTGRPYEATLHMVVDEPERLHGGVHSGGADKTKAQQSQLLRQRSRFRRAGR